MTECPPEFYECLTEEEYDEILDLFDEAGIAPPESMGDAQAAAQFVWDMLFLTPTELLTIGVTMTVLATYGPVSYTHLRAHET